MELSGLSDVEWEAHWRAVLAERTRRDALATAAKTAADLAASYAAAVQGAPPVPWAMLTGRVGPGQRVTWTDGNVWRNNSGAWLPTTATPATYPLGWSQETGLPASIPAWKIGEACGFTATRSCGLSAAM